MTRLGFESVLVLFAVLVGGCPSNEGGIGNTTTGAPGSTGGTTAADSTGSTGRGTDASSDGTTAGTSTSGTSTGPVEGTTSSTTDPPPESTGESEGETEGRSPGEGEPYGPCAGGTCMDGDAFCFMSGEQTMCLPACKGTNPSCPDAPPDNGSLVECIEVPDGDPPHCMLNCMGGMDCPAGTSCVDLGGIFRCLWS